MTTALRPDEVTAVRAARWLTVASAAVGILNYVYALALTRLLDVAAYSRFAAGQALILCASTVALVAVPWVLAQTLARARSTADRGDALRFAVVIATAGGIVASAAVAAVASEFAGPAPILALAGSTFLIFTTTVTVGWLQGSERVRTLSVLNLAEVGLKTVAGLLLVSGLALSDTGALAAFGIGALPFLFLWPPLPRGSGRLWRSATANRDLWRRALRIASVQGLVSLLAGIDVVLLTLLPGDRSTVASYQAGTVLARIPLFLASAISIAFFPALSRRHAGTPLARRALGMYIAVALPITAVLVTAPAEVVSAVFPARYSAVTELLRYTALAGVAIGGVNLATTFFQAVDDYTCVRWQAAGVCIYAAALLVGWTTGGVRGFAIGAACGAAAALALVIYQLASRQGSTLVSRSCLPEPLVLAGLLTLSRAHAVIWLIAAAVTGLRTAERFLHRSGTFEAPEAGRPGSTPRGDADMRGRRDLPHWMPRIGEPPAGGRT